MCNNSASAGAGFPLASGWNPADLEPIRASVATLVLAMKSPLNWGRAHRPEGSLFGHWRSGMEFARVSCCSTRRGGKGAPSTIRCIKTRHLVPRPGRSPPRVREHPAPSGALRPRWALFCTCVAHVREHPAPSGALRQALIKNLLCCSLCQGAPSTIRCIKTVLHHVQQSFRLSCQGAPSTIRCIET